MKARDEVLALQRVSFHESAQDPNVDNGILKRSMQVLDAKSNILHASEASLLISAQGRQWPEVSEPRLWPWSWT